MNLSENQETFLNFLLHFWNVDKILNIHKKKMTLIVDVFCKLHTLKTVVRYMSKKSGFRGPFDKQKVNGMKQCWNLNDTTFARCIDQWEGNWVGKSFS